MSAAEFSYCVIPGKNVSKEYVVLSKNSSEIIDGILHFWYIIG